ncbi:uncharacterized protein BDZ99DRAFT_501768 [Mytilinidion resinicola]|uniref:Uncharacterized protein n=1 Tax=Mytilinidion resinicola TaxID=574789 RepID=A0A6A6YAH5_9PEZI|nr:uncharacterized protein BDZ99DRAFT_501768 [Mytilinidion resinicola]KAF2805568.1 hypothetical protein BDZ99DRAFT_501768 [Mytilinidion resinicola]
MASDTFDAGAVDDELGKVEKAEAAINLNERSSGGDIPTSSSNFPTSSSNVPTSSSDLLTSSSDLLTSSSDVPTSSSNVPTSSSDSSDILLAQKERREEIAKTEVDLKARTKVLQAELHHINRTLKALKAEDKQLLQLINSQHTANDTEHILKPTSHHGKHAPAKSVATETSPYLNNSAANKHLNKAQVHSHQEETSRASAAKTHVRRDRSASPVREHVGGTEDRRRDEGQLEKMEAARPERPRKTPSMRSLRHTSIFAATPKAPTRIVNQFGKPTVGVPGPLQEEDSLARYGFPTVVPYQDSCGVTSFHIRNKGEQGSTPPLPPPFIGYIYGPYASSNQHRTASSQPENNGAPDYKNEWINGALGFQRHLRTAHNIVKHPRLVAKECSVRELTVKEVRSIVTGAADAPMIRLEWCEDLAE